jgi:hypothetical protein
MSVLDQLAIAINSRSEAPNQELAKRLVETQNQEDIKVLAENLGNKNQDIASDCIKTLYEIGYLNPDLIKEHVEAFLHTLHSRNNRMVWGGMITLGTFAEQKPDEIYKQVDFIKQLFEKGSVITIDNAVLVLAKVSAANPAYEKVILPDLLRHLKNCRSKEVPQHSEKTLWAVNAGNKDAFIEVLQNRMDEMTTPQANRVKKVIKEAQKKG